MGLDRSIVAREGELDAIERLLETSTGRPGLLELEGAAGAGKTTLWNEACRRARAAGRTVLAARGAGAEVRLGYAALGDLLADLDDAVLESLPTPQRRALEAALLRGEVLGWPGDPRAVATGLWSVLETLAAAGPVLLAIDDLQWLDPSSGDALTFAVRRVSGSVAVLAARREPDEEKARRLELGDPGATVRLALDPLPDDTIEALVRARVGTFTGAASRRIAAVAGGNPFIALELARTVEPGSSELPAELPAGLRELVDTRLATLDRESRHVLLYAATLTDPSVPSVAAALDRDDVSGPLGAAEDAGILRLDGARIGFSHPLMARGAYGAASGPQRREAHRRIAAVTTGEERARHLALSCVEAEPEAIDALKWAAASARARGAAAAAAELLELGLRLGDDEPRHRRLAAEHHLAAGSLARARELLDGLVEELAPGEERAAALGDLATIRLIAEDFPGAIPLLEEAIAEGGDERGRVAMSLTLTFALTQSGRLPDAVWLAAGNHPRAAALGDDHLLGKALAVDAMVRYLAGGGADERQIDRALALEEPALGGSVMLSPSLIAGLIWSWSGRLDDAQAALSRAWQRCRDRGEESELVLATMQSGSLVCLRGDLELGHELVTEGLDRAARLGSPTSRAFALENQLHVTAWTGEIEVARRAGEEALEIFDAVGSPVGKMFTEAALGRLELSLGDSAAAAARLVPAVEIALGMEAGDPGNFWWTADTVEALVAVDRLEEAEPIRAWQRERALSIRRPCLLALAARTDALVLAGRGDLVGAERLLDEALDQHDRQPIAYDVARTLLALGSVQRRLRRRGAARESLAGARDGFEELGARLWAKRAEGELRRIDAPRGLALTHAETRVATLVGEGLTNRAAAAELFVSPKTIEATLTRIYRKLDIHSRAELGGWVARRHAGVPPVTRDQGVPPIEPEAGPP